MRDQRLEHQDGGNVACKIRQNGGGRAKYGGPVKTIARDKGQNIGGIRCFFDAGNYDEKSYKQGFKDIESLLKETLKQLTGKTHG